MNILKKKSDLRYEAISQFGFVLLYDTLIFSTQYDTTNSGGVRKRMRIRNDSKTLIKSISKASLVSFDIFDTLLVRPFQLPTDLFFFLEPIIAKIVNRPFFSFYDSRTLAEKNVARRMIENQQDSMEYTYDEIYEEFLTLTTLSPNEISKIKQLEQNTEFELCKANKKVKEIYDSCLAMDKIIVLTSDMYYPEFFVKKLLKKNDIQNYLKIYMSCDHKASKHHGSIYQKIISESQIPPNKILHIGDNLYADIKKAKKNNIKTFHIKKNIDLLLENKRVQKIWKDLLDHKRPETSIFFGIMANEWANMDVKNTKELFSQGFVQIGFFIIGPLVFNFIQWVLKNSLDEGIQKLHFLARDGKTMKIVYDKISKFYKDAPSSNYIKISRKVLRLATVYQVNLEILCNHSFFHNSFFSVLFRANTTYKQYLESIGLYTKSNIEKLKQLGVQGENEKIMLTPNDLSQNYNKLSKILSLFKEEILQMAKNQHKLLTKYLQKNFLEDLNKNATVDVGWSGVSHFCMNQILKTKDLKTFLWGTISDASKLRDFGYYMKSFEVKGHKFSGVDAEITMDKVMMLELFLSSGESSVDALKERNGKITFTSSKEMHSHQRRLLIKDLHEGVNMFVKRISPLLRVRNNIYFDNRLYILPLLKIIDYPTYKETLLFKGIEHAHSQLEYVKFIEPDLSLFAFFFKPKLFLKKWRTSLWKPGVMVYLGKCFSLIELLSFRFIKRVLKKINI